MAIPAIGHSRGKRLLLSLAAAFVALGVGGVYFLKQGIGPGVEHGLTPPLESAVREDSQGSVGVTSPQLRGPVVREDVDPISDGPVYLSPADYLRTFPFEGEASDEEFDYDDPETLARRFGRSTIQQVFVLKEDGEDAGMLRRLRSVASIAKVRGIDLSDEEIRAIEASVVPKYMEQVEPLARVAVSEINRCIYDMYDGEGYDLTPPNGVTIPSRFAEFPDGEFRKSGVFDVVGGYAVRFDFNSAAYPNLEALLVNIGFLKREMEREVLGLIE